MYNNTYNIIPTEYNIGTTNRLGNCVRFKFN